MQPLEQLLLIIEDIANGKYSDDIMPLTTDDNPETVRRIAEAMGLMMVRVEAREYHLEQLVEELHQLNDAIRRNTINVVSSLANAIAARDMYTEGHTYRTSELAAGIARYLEMDEQDVEFVRLAGILHDIGKIAFPDSLFKPHEYEDFNALPSNMKKAILMHPATGAEILKDLDFLGPALEYVHCHHERPDGNGYPRGLHADEIPLGAKILAVADSYDAMTTDRPYQKGMTKEQALAILQKRAGNNWDPKCVMALEQVLSKR